MPDAHGGEHSEEVAERKGGGGVRLEDIKRGEALGGYFGVKVRASKAG